MDKIEWPQSPWADTPMKSGAFVGRFSEEMATLLCDVMRQRDAHINAFLQAHAASRETHELRIYVKDNGNRVYCVAPKGSPNLTLDEAMATLPVLSLDINIVTGVEG